MRVNTSTDDRFGRIVRLLVKTASTPEDESVFYLGLSMGGMVFRQLENHPEFTDDQHVEVAVSALPKLSAQLQAEGIGTSAPGSPSRPS
jgi:hypothetical protein